MILILWWRSGLAARTGPHLDHHALSEPASGPLSVRADGVHPAFLHAGNKNRRMSDGFSRGRPSRRTSSGSHRLLLIKMIVWICFGSHWFSGSEPLTLTGRSNINYRKYCIHASLLLLMTFNIPDTDERSVLVIQKLLQLIISTK